LQLTPDKVTKALTVDQCVLVACVPFSPARAWLTCAHRDFAAADARLLRASLSAFMDLLALATRTLESFS